MDFTIDDELITILKTTGLSLEARSQGWEYLLGLTASNDGIKHIVESNKYIPFLLSYISQERDELIKVAFKCLINIAAEECGTLAIIRTRKDVCAYLLKSICEKSANVNCKCYFLSNMSAKHEAVKMIIDILLSSKGLLQNLLEVYCSDEASLRSQCDYLTLVFANVSRLTEGRRYLLQNTDFMSCILKLTKSSEPECRRLGAALILRNCCLETDSHEKLLNDIDVLPTLLLPLMIPQQYEEGGEMGALPIELQKRCLEEVKGRDESISVRRVLVEALTVLCYSESGWKHLKSNGAYYVVRDLHAAETDEVTKASVEQLVTYFLVKEYTKPALLETSICEEVLTKQLEADFTRELPDFFVLNEK